MSARQNPFNKFNKKFKNSRKHPFCNYTHFNEENDMYEDETLLFRELIPQENNNAFANSE